MDRLRPSRLYRPSRSPARSSLLLLILSAVTRRSSRSLIIWQEGSCSFSMRAFWTAGLRSQMSPDTGV